MLRSTGNDEKSALLMNIERSDIHVVLIHLLQSEQLIFKLDNIKTGLTSYNSFITIYTVL